MASRDNCDICDARYGLFSRGTACRYCDRNVCAHCHSKRPFPPLGASFNGAICIFCATWHYRNDRDKGRSQSVVDKTSASKQSIQKSYSVASASQISVSKGTEVADEKWAKLIQDIFFHRLFNPDALQFYREKLKEILTSSLQEIPEIEHVSHISLETPTTSAEVPRLTLLTYKDHCDSEWYLEWRPVGWRAEVHIEGRKILKFKSTISIAELFLTSNVALAYSRDLAGFAFTFSTKPVVNFNVASRVTLGNISFPLQDTLRKLMRKKVDGILSKIMRPTWVDYHYTTGLVFTQRDSFAINPLPFAPRETKKKGKHGTDGDASSAQDSAPMDPKMAQLLKTQEKDGRWKLDSVGATFGISTQKLVEAIPSVAGKDEAAKYIWGTLLALSYFQLSSFTSDSAEQWTKASEKANATLLSGPKSDLVYQLNANAKQFVMENKLVNL